MIQRLFINASLLFSFLTLSIYSQTISEIRITGDDNLTDPVKKLISITPSQILTDSLPEEKAEKLLLLSLKDFGFFSVESITRNREYSPDSAFYVLTFNVAPGMRSIIREIIAADSAMPDLTLLREELEGMAFDRLLIEEAMKNLLLREENRGYPFSAVNIKKVVLERDSVSVYIGISSGPKGTIQQIEITGNALTSREVIIRELRLKEGETYSDELAAKIPPRLNRLRLFDPVAPPSFYFNSKDEGVLSISVKERQFNNFDGIMGYMPPGQNEKNGYITGLLTISLRNIFGSGRMAGFRWQKIDRNSQELEIKYTEPWLFSFPVNVSGGVFQRKQDTTYIQLKYDFSADYMLNENVILSWIAGFESIVPQVNDSIARFTVYNSSYFTNGAEAVFDSRNDPLVPERGVYLKASFSLSNKKIDGPAQYISPGQQVSFLLRRTVSQLQFYSTIIRRQVAALRLRYQEVSGDNLETNDFYRLGGNTDLRGYRENQFLASRILMANLEYRFLTGGRTFIYPFFDIAYYKRDANPVSRITADEQVKAGYGAGVYLETGAGMLRVEYGLAKGDSFSEGKIHFGIVSEF